MRSNKIWLILQLESLVIAGYCIIKVLLVFLDSSGWLEKLNSYLLLTYVHDVIPISNR